MKCSDIIKESCCATLLCVSKQELIDKVERLEKPYRNGKKAVFLFDYTGIMALPWANAGYICYCFDGQHTSDATPRGFAQAVFEANHYE